MKREVDYVTFKNYDLLIDLATHKASSLVQHNTLPTKSVQLLAKKTVRHCPYKIYLRVFSYPTSSSLASSHVYLSEWFLLHISIVYTTVLFFGTC